MYFDADREGSVRMAHTFRSFPHQEGANGPWRGAVRTRCQQFVDLGRRWTVTIALISALVVLSAVMHWSV
jgi:hypothetical protein